MRHSFSALFLLAGLLLAGCCHRVHSDATTMATPKGRKVLSCPANDRATACAVEIKKAE